MADISEEIQAIEQARFGPDVRGAIVDALEAMNENAEAAESWATGGSGGTPSATNNAKYYAEQAAEAVEDVTILKTTSLQYKGAYPDNSDVNNCGQNTVYTLQGNYTYTNKPPVTSGTIATIGVYGATNTSVQICIEFNTGVYYYRNKVSGTWRDWLVPDDHISIKYKGTYPNNSDVNNCEQNTIYTLAGSYTYDNKPPIASGTIVTIGVYGATNTSVQICIEFSTGYYYYRNKASGSWSPWINPNDNRYAKMFIKGNSIMVGSVWTLRNGAVSLHHYPSAWGNAPYSVVAKRFNISQQNVNDNILHSSTGFLFVPTNPSTGEPETSGSFLDNIIGNESLDIPAADLTNTDYLMTHFWFRDLMNYQIGSTSSTEGDGSLAGGVKTLVDFLNANYPETRLILVSVPPCDTSISIGGNPFTKSYTYGTIQELDTVMHQLAETYHFKYIDWQNMNLSYYYQKYTGGIYNDTKLNNVHANNEDTYRMMGEYLAEHL